MDMEQYDHCYGGYNKSGDSVKIHENKLLLHQLTHLQFIVTPSCLFGETGGNQLQ